MVINVVEIMLTSIWMILAYKSNIVDVMYIYCFNYIDIEIINNEMLGFYYQTGTRLGCRS